MGVIASADDPVRIGPLEVDDIGEDINAELADAAVDIMVLF